MADGLHVVEVPTATYLLVQAHTSALQDELATPEVRDSLSDDLLRMVDELLGIRTYRYRDMNRQAALEAQAAGRPTVELVFRKGREGLAKLLLDVVIRLDWLSRHGDLRTPPAPPEAIELLRHLADTLAERAND